jgi:glyoxylase-like metal-dependent hydrolase (beta-lactamase superfamily II)
VTGAQALKKVTNAGFVTGVGTGLPCSDILLDENETIHFGNEVLYAIPTPGHTDGCTTYRWHDRLFTGDTLLINACGRTDFQQGNPSSLYHSLEKILAYPNEYLIYPAHDYNGYRVSSVKQEKNNNPYIFNITEDDFINKMNNLQLPNPHMIDISVPANLQCGKFAA